VVVQKKGLAEGQRGAFIQRALIASDNFPEKTIIRLWGALILAEIINLDAMVWLVSSSDDLRESRPVSAFYVESSNLIEST
jgi:hypothetical protein